ncbi:MAG: regulator of sigma protease [Blastocatellia bacterium]
MGTYLQYAIVFVLVLGGMIVVHEFGHFIVAKLFGIRVDVFSVGFGKRLFGIKRGDTDYRLSLIPLGGYVKMAGENLDEAVTGAPYEFQSKPKWQRLCVAVAGPVMNILTALLIPAAMAMAHYEMPTFVNQPVVVNSVVPGSPAEAAGLRRGDVIEKIDGASAPNWGQFNDIIALNPGHELPVTVRRGGETLNLTLNVGTQEIEREKIGEAGLQPYWGPNTKIVVAGIAPGMPAEQAGLKVSDQIIAVNGRPVEAGADPATAAPVDPNSAPLYSELDIIRVIRASNGQPITMTVKRGDETLNITATPKVEQDNVRLGFNPGRKDADVIVTKLGPATALKYSWDENLRYISLTKTALAQVFAGKRSAGDTVTGPVGIAQIVGQASEQGATEVLRLTGLLSLNLGVFNLLPIPVLDGGLIFMILLEALLGIFGLPLTMRVKERMMQVGLVMLMLLMGFVIFNDISKRFISRSSAPQTVEQPKQGK